MKRILLILALAMTTAVAAAKSEMIPGVFPEPQKHSISLTDYVPFELVKITCADAAAIDWAKKHLKLWYGKFTPQIVAESGNTSTMGNEEYTLTIDKNGAVIKANTLQGARYALYTLRQLAIPKRGTDEVSGWIVPLSTIEDKPEMEFRGMHICWFPENEPWEIERMIRLAAYYKLNYAVIEPWGTFQSKVAPWWGWDDGKMTYNEIKRLKAIANDLGITLIPQINLFGHASNSKSRVGKHASLSVRPKYQPYFEPMAGWNWCLSNPKTKELQKKLIKEMYELFDCPPYFHIGCDEASGPSCPDCIKASYSKLFTEHVQEMSEYVKSLGARALMWHDMLILRNDPRWAGTHAHGTEETAKFVHKLPKDVIICDWYYKKPMAEYKSLKYFKELGFEVLACPWEKAANNRALIKGAHEVGVKGILGTLWDHYYGISLVNSYVDVANLSWNKNAKLEVLGREYHNRWALYTHLRQIDWDLKNKIHRRFGVYHYEIMPNIHHH